MNVVTAVFHSSYLPTRMGFMISAEGYAYLFKIDAAGPSLLKGRSRDGLRHWLSALAWSVRLHNRGINPRVQVRAVTSCR